MTRRRRYSRARIPGPFRVLVVGALLVRFLVRVLNRDVFVALARGRNRDFDRALDRALSRALGQAGTRAFDLVIDIDEALSVSDRFGGDRDRAFGRAILLLAGLARGSGLDSALHSARELVQMFDPNGGASRGAIDVDVRPVGAARWTVGVVVQVLPVNYRVRYNEEFRGELGDLAASGASRWRQLSYVVRLLDRAWELRAELRAATVRSKVAP